MWSGVAMHTASMFFASLSNISRKSTYFFAFSHFSNDSAARTESTSASATMFSVAPTPESTLAPRPPTPIPATFSFSLSPRPETMFGTANNWPAATAPVAVTDFLMKLRRVVLLFEVDMALRS